MKNQNFINSNSLKNSLKQIKKSIYHASALFGLTLSTAFVAPPQYAQFEGEFLPSSITQAEFSLKNNQISNHAFQHGEHLTYKIYYYLGGAWIGAGEVNFHLEDAGNQYKMMARGKTYSSYEWFFKVDDYFESWVDKNTLFPNVSYRNVSEGKFKVFDKTAYNQKNKNAYFERGRTSDNIDDKGTLKMSNMMHDVLSVLYYTRNMDFGNMSSGQNFAVNVLLDKQEYPLSVRFLGREQRKIKSNGTHKTIKFSPQVVAGNVFKEGGGMKVWASDDQNKIPLYIESPVSVGSVRVVLSNYSGLRYPLSSKLD